MALFCIAPNKSRPEKSQQHARKQSSLVVRAENTLRKSQYNSVDYVINGSFRKVFDNRSQEVIDVCLGMSTGTAGYCHT